MTLKLPTFKINGAAPLSEKVPAVHSDRSFQVEDVDLSSSGLSARIIDLIRTGKGITESYGGDESSALFAACVAMAAKKFTDQEMASVLTDRDHYLSNVSYRHAGNTRSRSQAAQWILKQNLPNARAKLSPDKIFEQAEKGTLTSTLKLEFIECENIGFDPSPDDLVEDLIGRKSSALLIGQPNSGKTFMALDLAFCVAQGKEWFGKSVEQGAVLYIAAEGGGGIRKRIVAYKIENKLGGTPVPLRLAYGSINLRSDVMSLIEEIKKTGEIFGMAVRLVVIDTLNCALSGGDENSSEAMGSFVKSMDLIRASTDAAVVAIHHSGKDETKGPRGHSLLIGAVDTVLTIEEKRVQGLHIVRTTKQRDYDYGRPICFSLKPIAVGMNVRNQTVMSCVVAAAALPADGINLKPTALNAFESLKAIVEETFDDLPGDWPTDTLTTTLDEWKAKFTQQHYPTVTRRQTAAEAFKKARQELVDGRIVEIRGRYARILRK